MASQDLCSSSFHHFSIFYSSLNIVEYPELGSNGDAEVLVQYIDW